MAAAFYRFSGRFGLYRRLQQWSKISISMKNAIHTHTPLCGVIKIDMPSLSPTMEKGNIVKWYKKEGDSVAPGDVLCDIETDKATIAMDTEEEGILAKIIAPDNTKDVNVGSLIALIVEEGDDWKAVEVPADAGKKKADAPAAAAPPSQPAAAAPAPAQAAASPVDASLIDHGHLIGPAVKKLLHEYNLSPSEVKATGHSGALLKSDVLEYVNSKNLSKVATPAPPPPAAAAQPSGAMPSPPPRAAAPTAPTSGDYVDIPLSNMRRTIAKRLTESKTSIPHAYASIDSTMDAVLALRKGLVADGVKVSVNDFIIKASALALQRVPRVNAIWAGENSQLSSSVDISVAVATPNGLITPIVRGAGNLSVDQIGEIVKVLAGKAKEGKLQPEEYQGGTFTISNLGMFGIKEFTAVINPPQVAILAIGGSRPVALPSGEAQRMTVSLSYDSRAINEVEAVRFLEEFRNVLENPQTMLAGTGLDSEAEAFAF